MTKSKVVTDRERRIWLAVGAVDRGIGDGLTFVAAAASAREGKASWVLRYRFAGVAKEKVLGRYPDIALRDARELARQDRTKVQQGIGIAELYAPCTIVKVHVTSLYNYVELAEQLRGRTGERQVPGARFGLATGELGNYNAALIHVMEAMQ